MYMKALQFLTLAAAISFSACQSSKEETIDRSLLPDSSKMPAANTTSPVNTSAPGVVPFSATANTATATGTPVNIVQAPVPNTQASQPVFTAPGMNPPHGQPNHRCDIAVGAPLNSQPAQTSAPTPAPQQTVTMSQPKPVKTVTAPGMNPPHGEPNHRCDIAVGAPLNSPVKKTEAVVPANTVLPKPDDNKVADSTKS